MYQDSHTAARSPHGCLLQYIGLQALFIRRTKRAIMNWHTSVTLKWGTRYVYDF